MITGTRRNAEDYLASLQGYPATVEADLLLTSYADCEVILTSPDFQTEAFDEWSASFKSDTVIVLNGVPQRSHRRLFAPLFGRSAIFQYEHELLEGSIIRCLEDLKPHRSADGLVRADLIVLVRMIVVPILAKVLGLDDVMPRVARLVELAFPIGGATQLGWSNRPAEALAAGLRAKEDFIREFFEPAIKRRRELIAEHDAGRADASSLPHDFITLMLRDTTVEWDDDLRVKEVLVYLTGGIKTTSRTAAYAVAELSEWIAEHPEDRPLLQDVAFMHAAVADALRLHTSSAGLVRRAVRDVTLPSGRSVGAGQQVVAVTPLANRDRTIFGADADTFNPRRSVPTGVKPYGLSFGSGRHLCPGQPLVILAGRNEDEHPSDAQRVIVRTLRHCFDAGLRPDPDSEPRVSAEAQPALDSYPVVFDRL